MKVNPSNHGDRIGRGRPEQKLKITRGDGTKANGVGEEAQEGGKETRSQGQKSFGWSWEHEKVETMSEESVTTREFGIQLCSP